ncbi:iron chelate uptake ABC transporter family permease subunit [Herbiconiux sp. CPCC 205763]|uniref:Iron chelate uptake ABC transporter family permease subunit n=1 Tax=Herbiconiux aconitum TaxID=2970913 RepID=A0ABT2GRI9_9MICO|nr:iron chelate uptake ABC transporter family permease subunit [Herbiconiux aconitum]MCS5718837.1 iron chelate uptake ABC transporter family permease subunit [Herbiconiux aconitum]
MSADTVTHDIRMLAAVRHAFRRRLLVVTAALAAILVVLAVLALMLGDRIVAPADVVAALFGQGSGGDRFVVLGLRLPRLTLGLLVGACFGLAGAVFQSLLRNPLASPDIIGISQGASAAAVGAILLLGLSGIAVSFAAFGGAVLVAAVITLLAGGFGRVGSGRGGGAGGSGGAAGSRFVLIGIALAFLAQALIGYLLTRSDVRDAQSALVWLIGSIGTVQPAELIVTAVGALVLTVALAVLAPRLRMLQLGDEAAVGLGVRVTSTRLLLTLVGVGFAAVATAAAGPVAFVAFVSAPIARRLLGGLGPALVTSALVGAVVVTGADIVAQHAFAGLQAPVGIVTGIIGAPVLLLLLARGNRTGASA